MSLVSRTVRPGDLYAALPGARTHGARFAADARRAGAAAVLTDAEGAEIAAGSGLPMLVIERPREVVGSTAALVYGQPARDLLLIGVTGTQGKTTTSQLIKAGLTAAGRRAAVIGTMGTWVDGVQVKSLLTTPEAPDLHALFAVMREADVDVCAIEVSSHALVMGRVDGVVFDVAVFLNLGRDHLDFHTTVEDYFAAKADLFTPKRSRRALVNVDDEYGARLLATSAVPTRAFSPTGRAADWRAEHIRATVDGSTFVVQGPEELRVSASVPLVGAFNVANALCSLAAIGEAGGDVAAAATGIADLRAVPGRMERIDVGQDFSVVVDYAHKPDAVAATLTALRAVTAGRLTIVIGAGGDRDRGKRPMMGQLAAGLADVMVVTDDNPRTEDPAAIRAELIAGARAAGGLTVIREVGDRRQAIAEALAAARPADTVLIAGKGHETGQQVNDQIRPFDDRDVARAVLAELIESARPRSGGQQ